VNLTTLFLLVPKLRMRGFLPYLMRSSIHVEEKGKRSLGKLEGNNKMEKQGVRLWTENRVQWQTSMKTIMH
jgi:hypothetical protein